MRALVVYESMFGNTKRIADAVAAGLAEHMKVELVEVSLAPFAIEADVDLLAVGGPTHVHGMTTAFTRAQAAKQSKQIVSTGISVREWLEGVRSMGTATTAVTFDTRIKGAAILTGSAANGFAKLLRAAGFRVFTPSESFLIATKATPDDALLDGELEHARAWGSEIAAKLAERAAAPVG